MMDHKAFLFDHAAFDQELRVTLEFALVSGDCARLIDFINTHCAVLKDPYEGEPLSPRWKELLESNDAHQYGDFALTKYYDPRADIGLGLGWEEIHQMVAANEELTVSPVLGVTVGPLDNPFDPGKMGAYFQSEKIVHRNYSHLATLAGQRPYCAFGEALQMLKQAVNANTGLYVTF